MIAALMMLGTSAAFAGDSEPLKAVLAAKDFTQASQLLKQNLNQMANAQEKAKAYNHVTSLALKTFDAQNAIEAQNIQAKMLKQKTTPYDTLAFYQAAYDATVNAVECAKYDAQPNEKGKVKPKYTDALATTAGNARLQLRLVFLVLRTRFNRQGRRLFRRGRRLDLRRGRGRRGCSLPTLAPN